MRDWALLIEYDGGPFAGWQRQNGVLTVQQVLEEAASRIAGAPAASFVAGRTDAGVHAAGQVAMLALPVGMDARRVRDALNFHLKPYPVVVLQAAPAPPDWNPRFSATGRSYRYLILNRRARPALLAGRVWHLPHPVDVAAMREGAAHLLGRHDFTSFRAAACQANSPLRTLDRLDVTRAGDMIEIAAEARSFLHHQVRTMVGTLAQIGLGHWRPADMAAILAAQDRSAAGPNAPPDGLSLVQVRYGIDLFREYCLAGAPD
jgi:tRNA pseudouridine38-40 synthase